MFFFVGRYISHYRSTFSNILVICVILLMRITQHCPFLRKSCWCTVDSLGVSGATATVGLENIRAAVETIQTKFTHTHTQAG